MYNWASFLLGIWAMTGRTISHYEILAKLGEGGMGVVYRARDTRLDRVVAIKVLSEARLSSSTARERFEREAKAVSSLNHPHICTLHDVGREGETDFLVMEFVEGEELRGPLPIDKAVEYAVQITDALDHAHRKGVIHRDLKPANIFVTKTGVKVLDFGLAKLAKPERDGAKDAEATLTQALTSEGTIIGTPQYMSPEQIEGKKADARSDIFSFGAVLYELLTGKRAFDGKSAASVMAKVMAGEPEPIAQVQPLTPPGLDRVVGKCLKKEPEQRWQSAGDLRDELRWVTESEPAETPTPHRQNLWPFAAGLALALVFGLTAGWWLKGRTGDGLQNPQVSRFSFTPASFDGEVAVSPNGAHIAYLSDDEDRRVWVRDLDAERPRPLDDTAGALLAFWSPDSRFIGFLTAGELKRISVDGGPADVLCERPSGIIGGASWSPDGDSIVFGAGVHPEIHRVASRGGVAEVLFERVETDKGDGNAWPQYLPGMNAMILEAGDRLSRDIVARNLRTGETRVLVEGARGVYSSSGHILYQLLGDGDLWALPFSLGSLEPTGEAFPIAESVRRFSLAHNGTLVYASVGSSAGEERQLVWMSRQGEKLGAIGQPQINIRQPALSPEGRRVAVAATQDGDVDIWIHQTGHELKTRLTSEPGSQNNPVWDPTGNEITYQSLNTGSGNVYRRRADGTGEPMLLAGTKLSERPCSWSRNGRHLVYRVNHAATSFDLWFLDRAKDGSDYEHAPFLQTPFTEYAAAISPDSRFVAYVSDKTGRDEVYVRPFPTGEGEWPVSSSGGGQPRWSHDGKELFYVEESTMMAVAVTTSPTFSRGEVTRLFDHPPLEGKLLDYDVSADGQRFVVVEPLSDPERAAKPSIHVVQNFFEELRQRELE